ncbi:hypothetical protein MSG28_010852, partial [Choristoneura fumiferana]
MGELHGDLNDMLGQMQQFSWVDYVVFVLMLAISAVVGVYWGFMKKQTTQTDYLLGGRNMKVFRIRNNIAGIPNRSVHYLSMRFDNRVRLFGSILFAFTLIGWLPIVIYVPALAFNQVTGVDIHIITPIVCLVCIFYTSAGGLQAVVWTDVIQITAMVGAMALVAVKGTIDVGGIGVVWQRNMDSGRIEMPNWDPNPLARHTIWNLVVGGFIYWLQANSVNQTMVQRYLALPTLRGAKCAVVLFCIGISTLYCFCLYCGLLIYARFHDCDPLTTKLAKAKDQLLPLLVMDVLGDIPGSLSTSLNSMSAVVLEDFYKPFFKKELSETQTNWLLRGVVVLLALVFIVEKMGTILQLTMTLEAMTMGPQLGVFSMGILMPWVDATGALIGGASGLITMAAWCLTAQMAIARGEITHAHKSLTTAGCTYNYTVVEVVTETTI